MALLAAIGEFDSGNEFSEKWFRLASKCFEACGEKICEAGNNVDICNTFSLIDQFFEMHDINHIEDTHLGTKAFNVIKKYALLVMQKYESVIRSKESLKKFGANSTILKLVDELQETPQSVLKPIR